MYKVISFDTLVEEDKIFPISYNVESRYTSFKHNKRLKRKFLPPPGLKMLKIKNENTISRLYDIVHNMYEDLNIDLKKAQIFYGTFIGDYRYDEIYDPKTDLDEHLKKYKLNRRKRVVLFVHTPILKRTGVIGTIDTLNIKKSDKIFLKKICICILKTYFEPKDYNIIEKVLEKSEIMWKKSIGDSGFHRLHLDSLNILGPVFLINLGESWIDYIPFEEITDHEPMYTACRIRMDMGDVFAMDGDARRVFHHGVPDGFADKDYLRYAMILRIPAYYNRKKLCRLTYKYFQDVSDKWKGGSYTCTSDIERIK